MRLLDDSCRTGVRPDSVQAFGGNRYDVETTAGRTRILDWCKGGEVYGGPGEEILDLRSQDRRSNCVVDTGAGDDQARVGVSRGNTATIDTGLGNDILRPSFAARWAGVIDARLGRGNDDLTNPLWSGRSVVRGGSGTDRIVGRQDGDYIDLRYRTWAPGTGLIRGFETVWGMGGDNEIAGRSADETLVGGRGNDAVLGNRSADQLFGSAGDDSLSGGPGSDSGSGGPGRDACSSIAQRVNCEIVPNRLSSWPAGTHKGLAYGCRRSANRRT